MTIQVMTADGTAAAGSDYAALNQTVTLTPGLPLQLFSVSVTGDTRFENAETFVVNLTSPTNAIIADAQGVGTITNDDAMPTVSINDVSVTEAIRETVSATLMVSLSAASGLATSVEFATADGTAVAGSDYTAQSGTLVFAPGETSNSVTVPVLADRLVEANETFVVNLSAPSNASFGDNQGLGTILDNDIRPTVTITDPTTATLTATSPFLTIRGTATDDTSIQSIAWSNSQGGTAEVQGTSSGPARFR